PPLALARPAAVVTLIFPAAPSLAPLSLSLHDALPISEPPVDRFLPAAPLITPLSVSVSAPLATVTVFVAPVSATVPDKVGVLTPASVPPAIVRFSATLMLPLSSRVAPDSIVVAPVVLPRPVALVTRKVPPTTSVAPL